MTRIFDDKSPPNGRRHARTVVATRVEAHAIKRNAHVSPYDSAVLSVLASAGFRVRSDGSKASEILGLSTCFRRPARTDDNTLFGTVKRSVDTITIITCGERTVVRNFCPLAVQYGLVPISTAKCPTSHSVFEGSLLNMLTILD